MAKLIDEYVEVSVVRPLYFAFAEAAARQLEKRRKNDESTSARIDYEMRAFDASDWTARFYQGYTDMYDA